MTTRKKILYVDMDNVLVDFQSGINEISSIDQQKFEGRLDEVQGIFRNMSPLTQAVESFQILSKVFDTYILSTSPWLNPAAASDKFVWVQKYLGVGAYKRLILSHHKNLHYGDILIDDRTQNGADKFKGELILFGSETFPNWKVVTDYLLSKLDDSSTQTTL